MRRVSLITATALLSALGAVWPAAAQPSAPARPANVDQAARADFNGDTYSDLAIGAPGEDLSGAANAGIVNLLNGSASGLVGNTQFLTQGNPEASDSFGSAVAKGYFNADRFLDLAVGAPGETVGGAANTGAVSVFYGSASGLVQSTHATIMQGNAEANDRFGAALDSGDFNADGVTDLAVGVPGEGIGSAASAGVVEIFLGSGAGISGALFQQLQQSNPEANDRFGAELATARYNDDSVVDLAVGAPGEGVGSAAGAGTVALHYSVGGRLASPGASIYQASPETNDGFGFALAGGSFDGISPFDLAVGAPGETVHSAATAGAVDIFTGTAGGISGTNPREFYQGGAAASGAEAGDRFGASLAAGPFRGGETMFDLAIGAPGDRSRRSHKAVRLHPARRVSAGALPPCGCRAGVYAPCTRRTRRRPVAPRRAGWTLRWRETRAACQDRIAVGDGQPHARALGYGGEHIDRASRLIDVAPGGAQVFYSVALVEDREGQLDTRLRARARGTCDRTRSLVRPSISWTVAPTARVTRPTSPTSCQPKDTP